MQEFSAFIPKSLWPLVSEEGPGTRRHCLAKEGTILFCDVAGFTPLTEALMVLGREGSEELTRLLNGYFTRMQDILDGHGGDVLRFGGDAMTIFFPGAPGVALRAAWAMMNAMEHFQVLPTRAGEFSLSMKVGLSHGRVMMGFISDGAGSFDFYAAGPALDGAAEAEHRARPGEIVCHPSCFKGKARPAGMDSLAGGYGRLAAAPARGSGARESRWPPSPSQEALRRFLPAYLVATQGGGQAAEHRGVAVVFVSLRGLPAAGTPDDLHERLGLVYRVVSEAARRHGGIVNKLDLGDKGAKVILLFGAPYAQERREEMALRAALELARSASDWQPAMGAVSSHLFAGPVGSAARREYTVMGDGINLAARLMQHARPGQILCDEGTARKASGAIRFSELPPLSVKGKRHPVSLCEVIEVAEADAVKDVVLLERDQARSAVLSYIGRERHGPLGFTAAAGLGKTAVLEWAVAKAREMKIPAVRVPLGPFSRDRRFSAWRAPLRVLLGVRRDDPADIVVRARDAALAAEPKGYRCLLNAMLDLPEEETPEVRNLSPKERKDLSFAMLGRVFIRGGRHLYAFDNFQWADPLSHDFLSFLLADAEAAPWRIIVTYRPGEAEGPWREGLDTVTLAPLSREGITRLLQTVHGLAEVPKEVLAWFAERSSGNPAIVAALLATLEAAKLIRRDAAGKRVDQDRLFATAFPDTLEGLFLARVDRLEPGPKEVMQCASILGTSVSVNLLHQVSGKPLNQVVNALKDLEGERLIVRDTWSQRPYIRFAEALLRDAVYHSLPFAFKRKGHLALARLLDVDAEERPKLWPTLAHHYEEGGAAAKARAYHRLAGRDSFARYDNVTALRHLEYVCKTMTAEPGDVEDAFSLMDVYGYLGRWEEARPSLSALADQDANLPVVSSARLRLFLAKDDWSRQDGERAEVHLREALERYESGKDIIGKLKVLINLAGGVYGPRGKLHEAKNCLEKGLALPRVAGDASLRVVAAMNLGVVDGYLGETDEASRHLRLAHSWSVRVRLGPQRGMVCCNLAGLCNDNGRFAQGAKWCHGALAVLEPFALRGAILNSLQVLSVSQLALGRTAEAKETLLKIFGQAQSQGHQQVRALAQQGLAHVALLDGRLTECLDGYPQALVAFSTQGNPRDYLATLVSFFGVLAALNASAAGSAQWKGLGVEAFLESAGQDETYSHGLRRIREWLRAPESASGAWRPEEPTEQVPPEERLERRLERCEAYQSTGRREPALDELSEAYREAAAWPHFEGKLRSLRLACLLNGGLSSADLRESGRLLARCHGGVWGARLACVLANAAKDKRARKTRAKDAQHRLDVLLENSPDWACEALHRLPEVAAFEGRA